MKTSALRNVCDRAKRCRSIAQGWIVAVMPEELMRRRVTTMRGYPH